MNQNPSCRLLYTDASNTVSGNSVKNQTGNTVSGNTNTVSGNETTARQGAA